MLTFYIFSLATSLFFTLTLFGYGSTLTKKFSNGGEFKAISLDVIIGLSFLILFSQFILIIGFFNKLTISLFFIVGFLLSLKNIGLLKNYLIGLKENYLKIDRLRNSLIFFIFLLYLIIPLIFKMLTVPLAWDELMYHLPHAKMWAHNGFLSVNENFRYPWFPFNFDLLYSIPLLFENDIFPKFIHGLAGFLIAFLFNSYFKNNKYVVILFLITWFYVTRGMFEKAYVELGLSLFISSSLLVFHVWSTNKNKFYLFLSVFFMGIAVGIKYQALLFLPMYGLLVVSFINRINIKDLVYLLLIFTIPFFYWYGRNAFITGNPFNPVFGSFFGLYDWNRADLNFQFNELSTRRHFIAPHTLFFPFLLFVRNKLLDPNMQRILLSVIGSTILWYLFSGYGRYLFGILPWIIFFSSFLYIHVCYKILDQLPKIFSLFNKVKKYFFPIFIILSLSGSFDPVKRINRSLNKIGYDMETREKILESQISSYSAIRYINNESNLIRTYQYGAEDSIYFFDKYVMGEIFGFGRYSDFIDLNALNLHEKLRSLKIDSILINRKIKKPELAENLFNRLIMDKQKFTLVFNNNNSYVFKLNYD